MMVKRCDPGVYGSGPIVGHDNAIVVIDQLLTTSINSSSTVANNKNWTISSIMKIDGQYLLRTANSPQTNGHLYGHLFDSTDDGG